MSLQNNVELKYEVYVFEVRGMDCRHFHRKQNAKCPNKLHFEVEIYSLRIYQMTILSVTIV